MLAVVKQEPTALPACERKQGRRRTSQVMFHILLDHLNDRALAAIKPRQSQRETTLGLIEMGQFILSPSSLFCLYFIPVYDVRWKLDRAQIVTMLTRLVRWYSHAGALS